MAWNVCGSRLIAIGLLPALFAGCRASREQGEAPQTIVIRDETRPADRDGYDAGDRPPSRIEVIVAEPHGGGGTGAGNPSPLASLVGRRVKVQFRRDALGLSATTNAPVPLTSPGGRAVSIDGTVRSAIGGWLVLEREKNTYWVPQAAILLIEMPDAPTTTPTSD